VTWLKADAITNLASGAAVSVWPDSTGIGFNAIQSLTTSQPTFITSAINGLPAVRFNSAANNYLWFYRPVQDDFTMIFVFQSSQGIGTGTDFYSGAGLVNGEVSGTANDFGISLNASGQLLAGTGNPDTTARSGTGYNTGAPHVVTFKRSKSTGALALYVDNNQVAAAGGGTQSLNSPNQLVLGAQQTLNNFLSGDIAEVLIYNSALSDTDRNGIEKALKCKYGISGGSTPSAPTSLALTVGNRQISLNWAMPPGASSYNVWRSTNYGASYQLIASALPVSSYVDATAANGATNFYKLTGSDACGAGLFSTAVGALLPLPALNMTNSSSAFAFTWPGWANDWKLYSATNLTPPVLWSPVTNTASSNNNVFSVTIPAGAGNQFFRLASP
jgi:hypothetical protein